MSDSEVLVSIKAVIREEVDSQGVGFPKTVIVQGAEFLRPSAITDIAQEALNSHFGSYQHEFIAELPNSEDVDEQMEIAVLRRK